MAWDAMVQMRGRMDEGTGEWAPCLIVVFGQR